MLANANGRRLAVIVNEFGDVGIDGEILKGCGDRRLPGGEHRRARQWLPVLHGGRRFRAGARPDPAREPAVEHIVIETSGLALPKPLVQAFHWPAIKSRVTVDGVVAVVDGAALADGRVAADLDALARQRAADDALDHDDPIEEVFEDQIACADLVVLNKRDLLDAAGIGKALAAIARRAAARGARSSPSPTARSIRPRCSASASAPRTTSRTARPITTTSSITTTTISTASSWRCPRSPIRRRWRSASPPPPRPQNVLRIKGFVAVARQADAAAGAGGRPARQPLTTTGAWTAAETRDGALVVIGLKGLDRAGDRRARCVG